MKAEEKLYRMREAAAILGVHQNTIRRWEKEGKIKVIRAVGGHRKIPESEIKRLLGAPTPPHPPEVLSKKEKLNNFLEFVFTYCREDWDLVRKAIMIRDDFTCTQCGSKEMLDVHHINETARSDPENLITLCQKCLDHIRGKPLPPPPTSERPLLITFDRQSILNELAPVGMAQKTAYGELLSAAIAAKKFTAEELASRTKTPKILAEIFCKKMQELGYIKYENNMFELAIEVIK